MIDILEIKKARSILENELSDNMKDKDNDRISQVSYHNLVLLIGSITNYIKFLENPKKYLKVIDKVKEI